MSDKKPITGLTVAVHLGQSTEPFGHLPLSDYLECSNNDEVVALQVISEALETALPKVKHRELQRQIRQVVYACCHRRNVLENHRN